MENESEKKMIESVEKENEKSTEKENEELTEKKEESEGTKEKELVKKKKRNPFYFDGKIDIGHALTVLALIIGFLTLQSRIKSLKLSEDSLKLKVEEMSEVVKKLDIAERDRVKLEVETIKSRSSALRGNNKIWDWVLQNNDDLQSMQHSGYFELSIAIREIFEHIKKSNLPTKIEIQIINKLEQLYENSILIHQVSDDRRKNISEYEIKNKPVKLKDETQKEFNNKLWTSSRH